MQISHGQDWWEVANSTSSSPVSSYIEGIKSTAAHLDIDPTVQI